MTDDRTTTKVRERRPCGLCGGAGRITDDIPCRRCMGAGTVETVAVVPIAPGRATAPTQQDRELGDRFARQIADVIARQREQMRPLTTPMVWRLAHEAVDAAVRRTQRGELAEAMTSVLDACSMTYLAVERTVAENGARPRLVTDDGPAGA